MSEPNASAIPTSRAASRNRTHKLTVTAMLSAVAFLLMFIEFPIPALIPAFVKLDVSDLPELLAAFSLGPVYGVAVALLTEEQGWEALEGKTAAQTACESARTASQPEKRKNILPWAVPLGISCLGLLLLGIFASLFPAQYVSGAVATPSGGSAPERVVTGLYGFLLCNRLEWLFWLCVIVAAGSLAAGIWQVAMWNRIGTEQEPAAGEKKE